MKKEFNVNKKVLYIILGLVFLITILFAAWYLYDKKEGSRGIFDNNMREGEETSQEEVDLEELIKNTEKFLDENRESLGDAPEVTDEYIEEKIKETEAFLDENREKLIDEVQDNNDERSLEEIIQQSQDSLNNQ